MVTTFHMTQSYLRTRQMFHRRFRHREPPSKSTVFNNVRKYTAHGTSRNLNPERSGRPRSARTVRNTAHVRRIVQANPRSSCIGNYAPYITRSSFNRIMRLDLQLHPYRIQERFSLRSGDSGRRLAYSQWMANTPDRFLTSIIVSDEASFTLNGHVNRWNTRMYSPRINPPRDFTYDRPDSRQSVNVWVGLTGDNHIIGPFFINGNVNGQTYLNLINDQIVPVLHRRYGLQQMGAVRRMWWFHNGAPAHRALAVVARLRHLFPGRLVALGEPSEWPPSSPDLTPLDFFLWGYLKDRVYQTVPANLDVLEARIRREIIALQRTRLVTG